MSEDTFIQNKTYSDEDLVLVLDGINDGSIKAIHKSILVDKNYQPWIFWVVESVTGDRAHGWVPIAQQRRLRPDIDLLKDYVYD